MVNYLDRARRLREERGDTQQTLADYLGVSRTTYVKYEAGTSEPPIAALIRLADYYHVTLDDLLGHDAGNSVEQAARLRLASGINPHFFELTPHARSRVSDYIDDLFAAAQNRLSLDTPGDGSDPVAESARRMLSSILEAERVKKA